MPVLPEIASIMSSLFGFRKLAQETRLTEKTEIVLREIRFELSTQMGKAKIYE